jgi:hypothetical protein
MFTAKPSAGFIRPNTHTPKPNITCCGAQHLYVEVIPDFSKFVHGATTAFRFGGRGRRKIQDLELAANGEGSSNQTWFAQMLLDAAVYPPRDGE